MKTSEGIGIQSLNVQRKAQFRSVFLRASICVVLALPMNASAREWIWGATRKGELPFYATNILNTLQAQGKQRLLADYAGEFWVAEWNRTYSLKMTLIFEKNALLNAGRITWNDVFVDGKPVQSVPPAMHPNAFYLTSVLRSPERKAVYSVSPTDGKLSISPGKKSNFRGKPISGSTVHAELRLPKHLQLPKSSWGAGLQSLDATWFVSESTPALMISYEAKVNLFKDAELKRPPSRCRVWLTGYRFE